MAQQLRNSATLSGSNVTISPGGVFNGLSSGRNVVSLGNDLTSAGNVTFNHLTLTNGLLVGGNHVDTYFTNNVFKLPITGSIEVTGSFTLDTNSTICGTLTAQNIVSEYQTSNVIQESGSTKFGDSSDDTHRFSGSFQSTGSIKVGNTSYTSVSNDATSGSMLTTALSTESSVKAYTSSRTGSIVGGDTDPPAAIINLLRKNYNKSATSITNNTCSFNAITASTADGFAAVSENDFIFFNNGNVIEHDALTIQQSGSTFLLIVNPDSYGFDLNSSVDNIRAWGKFNA